MIKTDLLINVSNYDSLSQIVALLDIASKLTVHLYERTVIVTWHRKHVAWKRYDVWFKISQF